VEGRGKAVETPIGFVPGEDALTLDGLNVSSETMRTLLSVDPADFAADLEDSRKFLDKFGDRCPRQLRDEHAALTLRLQRTMVPVK
jgi:phosphoenolpyruvate carboxykinase (GTP)